MNLMFKMLTRSHCRVISSCHRSSMFHLINRPIPYLLSLRLHRGFGSIDRHDLRRRLAKIGGAIKGCLEQGISVSSGIGLEEGILHQGLDEDFAPPLSV